MQLNKVIQYISILGVIALAGCECASVLQGPAGPQGPEGPAGVAPSPTAVSETAQQLLIDEENDYRSMVGQEPLVPGLTCSLYSVPSGTSSLASAVLTGVGSFSFPGQFNQQPANNSEGLNILPAGLLSVYQNNYVLKCSGVLVVLDNAWHEFDITSDDGSILSVDGVLINNDGLHSTQTKTASKFLKYGIHSFSVQYLQASGQESLIVNEDGALMKTVALYH